MQQRAVCCPKVSHEIQDQEFSPEIQECGQPQNVASRRRRVVGGEITTPGEFPFSVLIGRIYELVLVEYIESKVQWICSGVLINSQFVLTAAHCKTNDKMFMLRLGFHTLGDDSNLDV